MNLQKTVVKEKIQSERKRTTTRELTTTTANNNNKDPTDFWTADFPPVTAKPEDSGTKFSKG